MPAIQSTVLDILVSLALIYAMLSILVSTLLEWFNHYRKERSLLLRDSIEQMLKDPVNLHYGHLFYSHPLVNGMMGKANKRLPQYLSAGMFADVLVDVFAAQARNSQVLVQEKDAAGNIILKPANVLDQSLAAQFEKGVAGMNNSQLKDLLSSMWQRAGGQLSELKPLLENWFNDHMDRASGWYKTRQRKKLLWFGFIVAIGLNVDSIHIVKVLSMDEATRTRLVKMGTTVADNYTAMADSAKTNDEALWRMLQQSVPAGIKMGTSEAKKYLDSIRDPVSQAYLQRADSIVGLVTGLDIPVGWDRDAAPLSWHPTQLFTCNHTQVWQPRNGLEAYNARRNNNTTWINLLLYLLGIAISGVSLSFGAPFWFDLLVKFVNIRRAGVKPLNKPKTNAGKNE